MQLFERLCGTIAYLASLLSLSGFDTLEHGIQAPLLDLGPAIDIAPAEGGPVFKPPTGRDPLKPGGDLQCNYSKMGPDWTYCAETDGKGCWLKNTKTNRRFDINTDYEKFWPIGIDRYYNLTIVDGWLALDGLNFTQAKYFVSPGHSELSESKYPGPWIQACWGDTVHITLTNNLTHNGTSIHWHGIRQLNTAHMDGVPGITQCPIAPGHNFTYTWNAIQYGSSWYHSHYSLQYADGAAGPLTIHGPTSADWDEPRFPILMTDWGHNSAFEAIWPKGPGLVNASILLNGVGDVTRYNNSINCTSAGACNPPKPYEIPVKSMSPRSRRYLLRLINISFESIFIFSIDRHSLTVISTDFVPIYPYGTTSVTIDQGPRKSFWIRTWRANCFGFKQSTSKGYEKAGILRYDDDQREPLVVKPWDVDVEAGTDEPYDKLHPVAEWKVNKIPVNDKTGRIGENMTVNFTSPPGFFPLAKATLGNTKDHLFDPMQISYSDPAFLNLNNSGGWAPRWVVYDENYTADSWVYLALNAPSPPKKTTGPDLGSHPIHLHGHDFAILQQSTNLTFPKNLSLKYDNPPRRDVVLLPSNGYVIIAFKMDNPGPWLMHCHIAYHASFGLAAQIMERQKDAANKWPDLNNTPLLEAQRTCNDWNKWWGDCKNWWHHPNRTDSCDLGPDFFSPDSGI